MTLALLALGGLGVLELALYAPPLWQIRRAIAAGLLVLGAWTSGLFFADHAALASGVVLLISLYRIFNLLRVVEGKMHEKYLRRVAWRTSWNLIVLQLGILGLWGFANNLRVTGYTSWVILAFLQVLMAVFIGVVTVYNVRQLRPRPASQHLADRDLPSISVCIPARNETAALDSCLRALIASDYPKLEILVLDDQSHDRTPDIIRSFAHDGVRFIKGNEPPPNWQAKNWAYKRLMEEASGQFLVFSGVDIRFEPGTLRAMITALLAQKLRMLSLLPANTGRDDIQRTQSVLLQPARYAWELCLPRQLLHRPPVLSTCWAIDRQLLTEMGGFNAVARTITPESYFAKAASRQGTYHFVEADDELEVKSMKSFRDQWDTAVRARYPQLHRRPELVLLLSATQVLVLVLPFVILPVSLAMRSWLLAMLSAVSVVLQSWVYAAVVAITYRRFVFRSLLALPLAISLDVALRHISMWRYEFGQVIWKGRDVSTPVMHVTPHLPPLE